MTFTVDGKALDIVNADGPLDVEKLKAVMVKYGLVPAMPRDLDGAIADYKL